MRNAIILGSGRSGTSMLAGTLAGRGWFMGERLLRANDANPKGFFEDVDVNRLNEDLLWPYLPHRPPLLGRWWFRDRPVRRQLWLARLAEDVEVSAPAVLVPRIQGFLRREPWCFKDPRFCYTLAAWRPHLRDAAFLVVFRDPASTAESIQKEKAAAGYLRDLRLTFEDAVEVWTSMYRHVLAQRAQGGDWCFLHFDQVLSGAGLDRVEHLLAAPVDRSFPEPALRRTVARRPAGEAAERLYGTLCELAVS